MPTRLLLTAFLALACSWPLPVPRGRPTTCPDEVIVKYRDGTGAADRSRSPAGRGHRASRHACRAARSSWRSTTAPRVSQTVRELRCRPERGLRRARTTGAHASAEFTPDDPGLNRQWNLIGPFGLGHARGLADRATRRSRRQGRHRGGARQRRRLREPRAASAARPTSAAATFVRATTSSVATATPTTCSATAPTWPARSPRRPTTASAPRASPTREDHAAAGAGLGRRRATRWPSPAAIRYAASATART